MSFDVEFARKVVDQCYDLYKTVSIRKRKVLAKNEWTNMACIVKTTGYHGNEGVIFYFSSSFFLFSIMLSLSN